MYDGSDLHDHAVGALSYVLKVGVSGPHCEDLIPHGLRALRGVAVAA